MSPLACNPRWRLRCLCSRASPSLSRDIIACSAAAASSPLLAPCLCVHSPPQLIASFPGSVTAKLNRSPADAALLWAAAWAAEGGGGHQWIRLDIAQAPLYLIQAPPPICLVFPLAIGCASHSGRSCLACSLYCYFTFFRIIVFRNYK